MTFVRCGRCDAPICVDCMVDSPVGKKCRDCARNRTHLHESTPGQVTRAFVVAVAVAVPTAWMMQSMPIIFLMPFIYGFIVGEAALLAGKRSRSTAMQVATGLASVIGCVVGFGIWFLPRLTAEVPLPLLTMTFGYPLAMVVLGTAVAVSRVRYL
jgi:hypothetical protein